MIKNTDGRRERKRIETRKELEAATITLAMRDGLEQTTIEAISERANVSPRTFFNYFDSKEEAILGLRDIDISDDAITDHIRAHQGDTIVESVVALMINVIAPSLTDPALYKSRIQLIRQHPQLLERQINRTIYMTKQLATTIQRVAVGGVGTHIDEAQAEVLLALCASGIRVSIREWIETGKKISPSQLEQRTIKIINEVIKKI